MPSGNLFDHVQVLADRLAAQSAKLGPGGGGECALPAPFRPPPARRRAVLPSMFSLRSSGAPECEGSSVSWMTQRPLCVDASGGLSRGLPSGPPGVWVRHGVVEQRRDDCSLGEGAASDVSDADVSLRCPRACSPGLWVSPSSTSSRCDDGAVSDVVLEDDPGVPPPDPFPPCDVSPEQQVPFSDVSMDDLGVCAVAGGSSAVSRRSDEVAEALFRLDPIVSAGLLGEVADVVGGEDEPEVYLRCSGMVPLSSARFVVSCGCELVLSDLCSVDDLLRGHDDIRWVVRLLVRRVTAERDAALRARRDALELVSHFEVPFLLCFGVRCVDVCL